MEAAGLHKRDCVATLGINAGHVGVEGPADEVGGGSRGCTGASDHCGL
eukprot:CAMPEP_0202888246 /NCGR_PEP_ID=MMETSP1391-20130828/43093_1 /ASSEMBLY_ACC=CAM_ASM_000867 /TAXON_ID=1034604 /ORGANISM="Chlamydomonas leiostraca, Strain SAG 11-49" /LENGTH=47 /DNA_ID= /DNA_START= /DNA_END= /DNA_ORIENTATION=